MNENDFRKEYERMQHQVRASSDLKERTLAAAERAADRFASSAQPVATASAKRPHRRAARARRGGHRCVRPRLGLPLLRRRRLQSERLLHRLPLPR